MNRARIQRSLPDCMCTKQRLRSACALLQSDQSLQGTLWVAKDRTRLHAESEDSDQPVRMHRLI